MNPVAPAADECTPAPDERRESADRRKETSSRAVRPGADWRAAGGIATALAAGLLAASNASTDLVAESLLLGAFFAALAAATGLFGYGVALRARATGTRRRR